MSKFLQEPKEFNPERHHVRGMYVSAYLDGVRVFWDGGLSRDFNSGNVPWANVIDPKTRQRRLQFPRATGFWSQYGLAVPMPDWFLNQMPPWPLDGVLWMGYGKKDKLIQIITRSENPKDWESIQYAVFGTPALESIFVDHFIKSKYEFQKIRWLDCKHFITHLTPSRLHEFRSLPPMSPFEEELAYLRDNLEAEGRIHLHRQTRLPMNEEMASAALIQVANGIAKDNGIGFVIRKGTGIWRPKSVPYVRKWFFNKEYPHANAADEAILA
jgi:hypothetical protein